jgi:hypothetical protein
MKVVKYHLTFFLGGAAFFLGADFLVEAAFFGADLVFLVVW